VRCTSSGHALDLPGPGGLCAACLLKPGLAEGGPAPGAEARGDTLEPGTIASSAGAGHARPPPTLRPPGASTRPRICRGRASHGPADVVMEYAPGVPLAEYCDARRLCTRWRHVNPVR